MHHDWMTSRWSRQYPIAIGTAQPDRCDLDGCRMHSSVVIDRSSVDVWTWTRTWFAWTSPSAQGTSCLRPAQLAFSPLRARLHAARSFASGVTLTAVAGVPAQPIFANPEPAPSNPLALRWTSIVARSGPTTLLQGLSSRTGLYPAGQAFVSRRTYRRRRPCTRTVHARFSSQTRLPLSQALASRSSSTRDPAPLPNNLLPRPLTYLSRLLTPQSPIA
ncbi:hypothetical protein V8D89_013822 [Ganoderma adspersum]